MTQVTPEQMAVVEQIRDRARDLADYSKFSQIVGPSVREADALTALTTELTTLRALVAAADMIQFPKTSYPGLGSVPYIKANGDGTFKAGRAWKGHYQERDSVPSVTEAYQWIAEDEAFEVLRET